MASLDANPAYVIELAGDLDNVFLLDSPVDVPLDFKLATRIKEAAGGVVFLQVFHFCYSGFLG